MQEITAGGVLKGCDPNEGMSLSARLDTGERQMRNIQTEMFFMLGAE